MGSSGLTGAPSESARRTTMSDHPGEGSITRCIGLLKAGDRAAAQPLWEAYFRRLVALARARLRALPRASPPTRRTWR